jgi:hypothetical protein
VLSTPPAFVLSQDQTLQFHILGRSLFTPAASQKKLQKPVSRSAIQFSKIDAATAE